MTHFLYHDRPVFRQVVQDVDSTRTLVIDLMKIFFNSPQGRIFKPVHYFRISTRKEVWGFP